jgi:hypothetical protein
MLRAV